MFLLKFQIDLSNAHVKQTITNKLYSDWNRSWQTRGDCRQTFAFMTFVDRSKSKKISELTRYELGTLIRYVTGHVHLRKQNFNTGDLITTRAPFPEMQYDLTHPEEIEESANGWKYRCRLCQLKGTEETPLHLYRDCYAVWRERLQSFNQAIFTDERCMAEWEPKVLVTFFNRLDLENKENRY